MIDYNEAKIVSGDTKLLLNSLYFICANIAQGETYDIYLSEDNKVYGKYDYYINNDDKKYSKYEYSELETKIVDKLDYLADKVELHRCDTTDLIKYSYTNLTTEGEEFVRTMELICR